jgi:predicted AlkP superfamily pyrophosphatase or phosphodiesterase
MEIAMIARVLAALLSLVALAGAPLAVAQPAPRPTVILVSIDGFRADYPDRGLSPNLARLAEEGVSAAMRPSFPTLTFPNHYTLVTGRHPDRHGIVGNSMVDAELGDFSLRNTAAVSDGRWWDEAEPIWVTAEKAGLPTATLFWPGSEAEILGVRPRYWLPYDKSLPGDARVDRLLAWLDRPEGERPVLSTLYFDIVDTAGHLHGPDASETEAAVASVDASIGRLIDGLKARGLYDGAVLIVVSDHGMAATSPDRTVYLDDLIDPAAVRIVYMGASSFLIPGPGREAEVDAALPGAHPHLDCWRKGEIPSRLALGANPRVTPIVCLSETGWLLATRARPVTRPGGAHGYDNVAPEMAALFIARGPGVVAGRRLTHMDSVDVQPFIGRLLGLAVPEGDGRPEDTLPAMAR